MSVQQIVIGGAYQDKSGGLEQGITVGPKSLDITIALEAIVLHPF
jgi:hypothetical protein